MSVKYGKVKRFIKRYSHKIIGGSVLIGAFVVGKYIYREGYIDGSEAGEIVGFEKTIKWCDDEFKDIQLREHINTWEKDNHIYRDWKIE